MRILNFGSLNIDHMYKVDRFVKPGETIGSNDYSKHMGGKGLNQSIALARAGAEVYHAGCIGEDGLFLKKYMHDNGVNTDYIKVQSVPTGHAIIQVEQSGQNCIILYGGANQQVTREFIDDVLINFSENDILLIQNEINQLEYLISKAYEKGMQIAINPSPISKNLIDLPLQKITWFILNEIEGEELTGKKRPDDIISELLHHYPHSRVVLTLGKNGVIYADASQRCSNGVYKVNVVDTTAAGDTFAGYLLCGISRGMMPDKAIQWASKASAITITRLGAAETIPTAKEVRYDIINVIIEY